MRPGKVLTQAYPSHLSQLCPIVADSRKRKGRKGKGQVKEMGFSSEKIDRLYCIVL